MRVPGFVVIALLLTATAASAGGLIEPHMRIAAGRGAGPQVALTLDACSGAVDMRIVGALIDNGIPATIFVTAIWLKRNLAATALLLAHPDLFEIEDHGAHHVPAIIGKARVYGLMPAGTAEGVFAEISGGAQAIVVATSVAPRWYRGATALYTGDALDLIASMGYRVGAFSLNADFGASLSAANVARRIAGAADGDVIIAHVNQPTRAAGAGVVAGVLALKAKGFRFVRLEDVAETAD